MQKSRLTAWIIWATASVFYAYQYILRVMPNIMLEDFVHQFHIDYIEFSQFSGIYYIGYAVMHLPLGIMLDRYGPKKVMTGCIFLTVLGLLPIIFAENWIYPLMGRLLIGMGSSAAILGVFKIIRMTFTEQQFTRMLSLSVTIGLIGAIWGSGPVSALCSSLGYQTVIKIFALFGVFLTVFTYFIIPDLENARSGSIKLDLRDVLTNKKVIAVCFLAGLMVGPLEGFPDVWGAAFLQHVYGFSTKSASYMTSLIFMGMCFGAPVLSYIGEKSKNYLLVIIASGLFMMISFSALIFSHLSDQTMVVLFILVGTCCAYQILAIYKASTYVPAEVAGLTTAIANMIIMSFGYAFHTTIGFIINIFGGSTVSKAFIYGIGVIPVSLGIAVIGFAILLHHDKQDKHLQS